MAMLITYPDDSTRLVPQAVRVDEQNFHEGMIDYYDEAGTLPEQIDMGSGSRWKVVDELIEDD